MLFSHLTTKILTINISVIACSLEEKTRDETHLSKLSCGTCLHMQVTAALAKSCCFWQQFRSYRRKEVVLLSLWASQTEPVHKCLSPAKWFEPQSLRRGHGKPSFPLGIPPGQVLACSVQRRRVGGLVSRRSVPFLSPHSGPATHCCVLAPTPIVSSGPGLESPGPLPCPAVTSAPSPRRSFTPRGIDMSLSEQTPASPRGQEVGKGRLKRV